MALWHCPQAVPKPDGWVAVPLPAASPTLHPVQSPQTRFCVLTVAPDTLPAIATMLIDVLFYSHRWVPGMGTRRWPLARCHLNRGDMFPPPLSPCSQWVFKLWVCFANWFCPPERAGGPRPWWVLWVPLPLWTWEPRGDPGDKSPHCSKARGRGIAKQERVGCKRQVGTALGCGDAPGRDIPCPMG